MARVREEWQRLALVVFGLLLAVVLLEAGLRIAGLVFLSVQERRNQLSLREGHTYRVLCIGESTTALGGGDSYPSQLERSLNARGKGVSFSVINRGLPAVTTDVIVGQLEENLARYRPDVVVAMMGINDPPDAEVTDGQRLTAFVEAFRTYKLLRWIWLGTRARLASWRRAADRGTEEALARRVRDNPHDAAAWLELGLVQMGAHEHAEAEATLRHAIALDPTAQTPRVALVQLYWFSDRPEDARRAAEELVDAGLANDAVRDWLRHAPATLATWYAQHGRLDDAERELQTFHPRTPAERAYLLRTLGSLARMRGDQASAEDYLRRADALASDDLSERTRRSYLEMLRLLEASGIPLVAVQYPVRRVEPLRRLLGARKDVWIVDNEAVFKEALRQAPYAEYFVDTFGGDFGHTTPQGAHLLAENVAQSILAGLFRQ
ncbi:MAG: hypothetical protein E6J81_11040 [Deltaproteobacteria bacterium]|nr:MAG: hypothetical protein E6J81_11040 [Deltaproteobacteria bacterium]